jgi:hypothetical protein
MSIADSLRAEQAERLKRLDATARVELAFSLGRRDIALYAAAHAVTEDEARLKLRAQRSIGRVHSCSVPGLAAALLGAEAWRPVELI